MVQTKVQVRVHHVVVVCNRSCISDRAEVGLVLVRRRVGGCCLLCFRAPLSPARPDDQYLSNYLSAAILVIAKNCT